jgi:hypothetical protein
MSQASRDDDDELAGQPSVGLKPKGKILPRRHEDTKKGKGLSFEEIRAVFMISPGNEQA